MSVPACPAPWRQPRWTCAALLCGAVLLRPALAATDLTALSLEQLLGVMVVGASKYEQKQTEVAASVSVITRDEIRAFGWRTMADALASLPGIHTTYDRQYTFVGARGFGLPGDYNTRILLAINGNRSNDVTFDQAPMGRDFPLDMDLIERIEFIPGPGGAVYGQNAMFGVVNVVTRNGASLDGTELAAARQQPQRLGEVRASWGRVLDNGVDVLLSASVMRARGENRYFEFGSSGMAGVARDQDGGRDKELAVRVARGPWSVELVDGQHRKDNPIGTYKSDPLVPGQFQGDRYTLAQWQYDSGFLGEQLNLQTRLFAGRELYSSLFSYGTRSAQNAVSDWRGVELRLVGTLWAGHKWMLGLEYQDNPRIKQFVDNPDDPTRNILVVGSGQRFGLYVQDEWRLNEALRATVGLRLDKSDTTGTQSSPRAALIWQANPATTLKALLGRAHRAPNAYERDNTDGTSFVGNPSLRGESIDTAELVADHRLDKDLLVRVSTYRWTMRGLITLGIEPGSGLVQYQSGDTVHAKGLELSMDKTWNWGGRLRGSLSLQHARTADGAGNAAGAALVNSPQRLAKLNFSTPLAVAGARLGLEVRYDSARRTADGTDVGGYVLSNLKLSTDRLAKGLDLSLAINNLSNKPFSQPNSGAGWQNVLAQDGRSVRLETQLRF